MQDFIKRLRSLTRLEEQVRLVDYAVILSLIAIVSAATIRTLRERSEAAPTRAAVNSTAH
jgi:Flp pilus assembly pilin Flp